MFHFIRDSIRNRLKAAFIALVMIPLIFWGVVLIWRSYVILSRHTLGLQREVSERIVNQIENHIRDIENEMKATATGADIINNDRERQAKILSRLRSDVRDLLPQIHLEKFKGSAYILDSHGRLLAHSNPSLASKAVRFTVPEGPGLHTGLSGVRVFIYSQKMLLGDQALLVVTERPVSEALDLTIQIMIILAVMFGGAIGGAVIFGLFVGRKIVRPIESLALNARAISGGDLSVRAEETTPDEVGALANAFNTMSSELIMKIDALKNEIEERKKAEEKIKASLEEKEILLREIHHRVKNNMQIISSILHLQSGYVRDEQSLKTLIDSKSRIDVMALIHDKLYKSKSLSRIDFQEYITELVTGLFISYGVSMEKIKYEINAGGVYFDVNTAIPCGLILNELVTNCLKHCFPGGDGGNIKIHLGPAGDGKYTLTVSDNGVGLPEDFDLEETKTLGLKLVTALAGQLDGAIEVIRNKGTTFKITFSEISRNAS